jgi:cell volume regulation protein A
MAFDITLTVTYFAILLGFGVLIANVLKKYNIPDTFFLLLLGLVMGPTVFMNPAVTSFFKITLVDVSAMGEIPDFLRTLALILLVFTGIYNLSWRIFKKFSDVSVKLAFGGVVVNTILLGLVAHLLFGLNPIYSLLLGAVISGTGEGVVATFENTLAKYKRAVTIIKLESIFNSPTAVIFPLLFLGMIAIQPGALLEPLKYLSQFWLMIVAGIGTGILVGFASSKIMGRMLKAYSSLILFALALIAYALAENVGGSGMLAVAVCGLIVGNLTLKQEDEIKSFEDQFTEMLRISVFTLLGAQVMLPMEPGIFIAGLLFALIVFACRPIFVIPLLGSMRKTFTKKDIAVMSFIAPKGTSEAAMAPLAAAAIISAGGIQEGNFMMNIIFLVIIFSILFSTIVALLLGRVKVNEAEIKPLDEYGDEDEEKKNKEDKKAKPDDKFHDAKLDDFDEEMKEPPKKLEDEYAVIKEEKASKEKKKKRPTSAC